MKLIIAGGRNYKFTWEDIRFLDELHKDMKVTEVVSGGASGADQQGEFWAGTWDIPVKRFEADWKANGKAAGPIRNRQMAAYADAAALFPGGRGTDSMFREATKTGLKIFDRRNRVTTGTE